MVERMISWKFLFQRTYIGVCDLDSGVHPLLWVSGLQTLLKLTTFPKNRLKKLRE